MVRAANDSSRMNVMLTDGGQSWAQALPRLLEPQGVHAIPVRTVDEAVREIEVRPIHVALVDLALPLGSEIEQSPRTEPYNPHRLPGGLKLLQILRRQANRPPAIVAVRGRLFDRRFDDRLLAEALKLDVFSVLDKPVELEQLLQVLMKALRRHYGDAWPGTPGHGGADNRPV